MTKTTEVTRPIENINGHPSAYFIHRNSSHTLIQLVDAGITTQTCLLVFSMWMSREQLVQRLLCERSGVSSTKVLEDNLTDRELEEIIGTADALSGLPLYIWNEKANITIYELKQEVNDWYNKNKAEIEPDNVAIIIDHYDPLLRASAMADELRSDHTLDEHLVTLANELPAKVFCLRELDDLNYSCICTSYFSHKEKNEKPETISV